jgi:uncharacterized membrane protein
MSYNNQPTLDTTTMRCVARRVMTGPHRTFRQTSDPPRVSAGAAPAEDVLMRHPVVDPPATSLPRSIARVVLGAFLIFAGVSHLSFARTAFRAQVPPWLGVDADFVIITSGVVEIALGVTLVLLTRWRVPAGWAAAIFFVLVFPGNISQFATHADAFGLDSDLARGIRLLFQPLLVIWALWCTGAFTAFRKGRS